MHPKAQLKYLYTNAYSMRNKWEEKAWYTWKTMILLLSQKHGGMTRITGILPLKGMRFVELTTGDMKKAEVIVLCLILHWQPEFPYFSHP